MSVYITIGNDINSAHTFLYLCKVNVCGDKYKIKK